MLANCESLYLLTRSRIDIIMSFSVHSSESLAVHKFLCSASYVFFLVLLLGMCGWRLKITYQVEKNTIWMYVIN